MSIDGKDEYLFGEPKEQKKVIERGSYEWEMIYGGFSPRSLIGAEPWPSEAVIEKFRLLDRK